MWNLHFCPKQQAPRIGAGVQPTGTINRNDSYFGCNSLAIYQSVETNGDVVALYNVTFLGFIVGKIIL